MLMRSDNNFELVQKGRCINKITIAIDFKISIAQESNDFNWNIFSIRKIIIRLPIPHKRNEWTAEWREF